MLILIPASALGEVATPLSATAASAITELNRFIIPPRCLHAFSCVSGARKSSVDRLAVGHLTLPGSTARHAFRGICKLKLAAHVCTAGCPQIGNDTSRVMCDETRVSPPVVPAQAAPAAAPTYPQRLKVIDCRIAGDLKVLSRVGRTIGRRRCHRS